jgi:hypothetical protein
MIELIQHTTTTIPVPDMAMVRYVTVSRPNQLQLPVLAYELNWGKKKFHANGKFFEPTIGKITHYMVVNDASNLPRRIDIDHEPVKRKSELSEEKKKMIHNMRRDGNTWDEIAKEVGSNRTSVKNCYIKNKERIGGL